MDAEDQNSDDRATDDQIREAIEQLTKEDNYRLKMAATYCLYGTEYQDPQELINEALRRTMNAAVGEKGRTWKTNVPFIAFMIMTVKGIANDSVESLQQTRTDYIEALGTEYISPEDAIGAAGHCHPDIEELALEIDETDERQGLAKADVDLIERHFESDPEVSYIIMGIKDNYSPKDIKDVSGMSDTQYDTAKRRFRRGLEKLSLNRRKS